MSSVRGGHINCAMMGMNIISVMTVKNNKTVLIETRTHSVIDAKLQVIEVLCI